MEEFCNELVRLSGVSTEYATAAYYTLRLVPSVNYKQAAKRYCRRFKLLSR